MTAKEKAQEMVDRFIQGTRNRYEKDSLSYRRAKQCALIAVENKYHSLREMLFNLRSCHVIESEKVYLFRLQKLINEEQEIKQEIEAL